MKRGRSSFSFLSFFSWAAPGAQGVVEVKGGSGFGDPGVGAEGAAAFHTHLNAVDLALGEGLIDVAGPIGGELQRPGREKSAEFFIAAFADVEAGIRPELGAADKVGINGIALDVA